MAGGNRFFCLHPGSSRASAAAAGYVADRSDKIRAEQHIAGRPVALALEIRQLSHLWAKGL
jgi:hypothetical protein